VENKTEIGRRQGKQEAFGRFWRLWTRFEQGRVLAASVFGAFAGAIPRGEDVLPSSQTPGGKGLAYIKQGRVTGKTGTKEAGLFGLCH
jgi:hypothetical protein